MTTVIPEGISKSLIKTFKLDKAQLSELQTHDEMVMSGVYIITLSLTSLLQAVSISNMTGRKVKVEKVREACSEMVHRVTLIYDQLNMELPQEEDLDSYLEDMPLEYSMDTTLTVFHMLSSVSELAQLLFVDNNGQAIWADEKPSEDICLDLMEILVGICLLGEKYNFTLNDLWEDLGFVFETSSDKDRDDKDEEV